MRSNTWAGRFGASYAPPLPKRMVTIRAGYGMFHDPLYDNLWSSATVNDTELGDFNAKACGIQADYFAPTPVVPSNCSTSRTTGAFLRVTSLATHLRAPLVHSFFLGAQTRASPGWTPAGTGPAPAGPARGSPDALNRRVPI